MWVPQRGHSTSRSSWAPVSVTLETPLQKVQVAVNWNGKLVVTLESSSCDGADRGGFAGVGKEEIRPPL